MSLTDSFACEPGWRTNKTLPRHMPGAPGSREPALNLVIAQTSYERVDVLRRLSLKSARDDFAVAHLMRSSSGHGMTEPQVKAEAYTACVHLDRFEAADVWRDGQHERLVGLGAGTVHINDMRHLWRADIESPFNVVNFYIPQASFDEISEEEGITQVEELDCAMSLSRVDNVFKNLALAMLPALAKPNQTNRLFADHAARTVVAHLIGNYGSRPRRPRSEAGRLAPWQERRAKEMLRADLQGRLTLPDLAKACRLSPSHFSQAFKQTVGCPPHQWLLRQRVECAKQLILNTDRSLSDIALAAGFADQSHFTRVFSQRVKASPAAWRRALER